MCVSFLLFFLSICNLLHSPTVPVMSMESIITEVVCLCRMRLSCLALVSVPVLALLTEFS